MTMSNISFHPGRGHHPTDVTARLHCLTFGEFFFQYIEKLPVLLYMILTFIYGQSQRNWYALLAMN